MWTGIIVHKGDIWTMELNEWKSFHRENIIYESPSIHSSITIPRVVLPPFIPPLTTCKTEPPPKRSRSMTHASAKTLSRVGMAKVQPTFIGKQNQIPISTSEVHVTAAPIPPCRSMTSGENLTEVQFIRMNMLNVLS